MRTSLRARQPRPSSCTAAPRASALAGPASPASASSAPSTFSLRHFQDTLLQILNVQERQHLARQHLQPPPPSPAPALVHFVQVHHVVAPQRLQRLMCWRFQCAQKTAQKVSSEFEASCSSAHNCSSLVAAPEGVHEAGDQVGDGVRGVFHQSAQVLRDARQPRQLLPRQVPQVRQVPHQHRRQLAVRNARTWG